MSSKCFNLPCLIVAFMTQYSSVHVAMIVARRGLFLNPCPAWPRPRSGPTQMHVMHLLNTVGRHARCFQGSPRPHIGAHNVQ